MGTCRRNLGTVLEHAAVSIVADWLMESTEGGSGPLRYVDTHAMAPLNRPAGNDADILQSIRKRAPRCETLGLAAYSEVFSAEWLPRAVDWYPTHFVHAARAVERRGGSLDAVLFEIDAADARPSGVQSEDRRAELATFLATKAVREAVGLNVSNGRLSPPPGDFRDVKGWPSAIAGDSRALMVVSDPLEYRPERAPGGSKLGAEDLALIRRQVDSLYSSQPKLWAHVIYASGNFGTWGGDGARLAHQLGQDWRKEFAPKDAATRCGACLWGGHLVFIGSAQIGEVEEPPKAWPLVGARVLSGSAELHKTKGKPAAWLDC